MGKFIAATLLGAIALYAWGSISWIFLDWHKNSIKKLPGETAVVAALSVAPLDSGVYLFPAMPDDPDDEAAKAASTEKYEKGPIGFLSYRAEGATPMGATTLAKGFLICLIGAALGALILTLAGTQSVGSRILIMIAVGVITAVMADGAYWNYFYFSTEHTLAMMADRVIGWAIAGVLMGLVLNKGGGSA